MRVNITFTSFPITFYSLCCVLLFGCSEANQWVDQDNDLNYQWNAKAELGYSFSKTYVSGDGSAYAISQEGIVYYRPVNSKTWQRENMAGLDGEYWGINGHGNEVWIIGNNGLILYKKGDLPWVSEKSNADSAALRCIHVSGNEVWAAGSNGTIVHRLNENWVREESPDTTTVLFKIGGTPGNLWAVGNEGAILHKIGDAPWYKQECPEKNARLTNLLVLEDEVWAIATNGFVLHKPKNKPWETERLPTADSIFTGIYGWDEEVWICTNNGRIFHKKANNTWTKELDSGSIRNFYFTCMYGRQKDIWVVGFHAGILHRTANGTWLQEGKNAMEAVLLDIKHSGRELVAVGQAQSIVSKTIGEPLQKEDVMYAGSNLSGIYAFGSEIWVSDKSGVILYKNGDEEWRRELTGVKDFQILSGYRYGNEVWLVGTQGAILYNSGNGEWLNKAPQQGNLRLEAIYGDKDNVWVVGQQGVILHKASGDTYFKHEYPVSTQRHFANIKRIGDELWVVGGLNKILHKNINATVWDEEQLPAGLENISQLHYHDIYRKGNELWVCGSSEVVLSKKDNGNWKIQTVGKTETDLYRIHEDGNELLFVGENGSRRVIVQKNNYGNWTSNDAVESGLRSIPPADDLYVFSKDGFTYKKPFKNWMRVARPNMLNVINGGAVVNDKVYCIGNNAIVSLTPDERQYPVLSSIRYMPVLNGSSDSLEIEMKITSPDGQPSGFKIACDAKPYDPENKHREEYKFIPGVYEVTNTGSNSVTISGRFEITRNFGIQPSLSDYNKLCVRIHLYSGDQNFPFIIKNKTGDLFLSIRPDSWWEYKQVQTAFAVFIAYYGFWFALWGLFPLQFIRVYKTDLFMMLAELKPPLKQILQVLDLLVPFRLLVFTPHVMNAFIKEHKENLKRSFRQSETVKQRGHYVPLPLRVSIAGREELIDRPDARLLDRIFKPPRAFIQITGPGGAGKTTLAVALGNWLFVPLKDSKARIPVIIDSDTSDLLNTVMELLTAWLPYERIPASLVKYMLKKKRLVIIMDALSERKTDTQEHFKKIHNLVAANALVITSRREINIQDKDNIKLSPNSLDAASLVHFVNECLKQHKHHPVQDEQDRLAFAAKIADLVESNRHYALVLPVLVRLIIDNALSKAGCYESVAALIEDTPAHIPQVYFDYLIRMNPTYSTASNFLHDYQVIEVAGLMAISALNERFEPGDFKEATIYGLLSKDPQYNGIDVVQRFLDNDIITRRRSLGNFYLRFNLDPLAEYLGASRLYDEYQKAGRLDELMIKVTAAATWSPGFKMVFEQVKNYKTNNDASHENG